eukprot:15441057-Alexandrium_andersonii.AAC.1
MSESGLEDGGPVSPDSAAEDLLGGAGAPATSTAGLPGGGLDLARRRMRGAPALAPAWPSL